MRFILFAAAALKGLAAPVFADEVDHFNYMLHCQGCHLADGNGHEPAVPSIVDRLGPILEVPGGRAFLIQVPGTAQAPLKDSEIASLMNWILYRFNGDTLPGDFELYTADEISELRAASVVDIAANRRSIITALHSR